VRLYLVRHGETAHNRDGVTLGVEDAPLTALGQRQAEALGARLAVEKIDSVFASPLQRAARTAEAVAAVAGLSVTLREELVEMDVGETEGLAMHDLRARYAGLLEEWRGPAGHTVRMPGGESLSDVDRRVAGFLDSLGALGAERIVVVSHNFVIRAAICRLLGLGVNRFRAFGVDVASIAKVEIGPRGTALLSLNDVCHLRGLEP